jgi:hypothetical protein
VLGSRLSRRCSARVSVASGRQRSPNLNALSWEEMKFIFAISHAQAIQAFAEDGDEALRTEVERWWEPEAREAVGRALAEVA